MKRFAFLVLLAAAPLFAADTAYAPTDAERARWSQSDMHSIAICANAYKQDNGKFPVAADLASLAGQVEPKYVMHLPRTDAWGHPYRYISDGTTFRIVSAGADGKFDEASWSGPATHDLSWSQDSVLDNDWKQSRTWPYK